MGIPSVVVVTTGFSKLARLTAEAMGVRDIAIAEYGGPIGVHDAETIARTVGAGLVDRIVAALSASRAADPEHAHHTRETDAIAFTGTAGEVDAYFREQEWSDGLPIVEPTPERIEAFLSHVEGPADRRIAILPGANLAATPSNIAANAVMAGCRPEHMPLLVAAVEALADERCSLSNIGSSSGIVPYALVNGPIVKALGIEHGPQLVSRGPNPAIGRAIGLIVRNIAGFRPGARYMGTFGYSLPFVLAEDESATPWEPFHAERGFDAAASTVTIGVTNNWGPAPSPYATADQSGAQTALDLLCLEVTRKTRLFNFPAQGPHAEQVMVTLLLSPPVARSLADAGFSKRDVKRYIHEHARMRLRDFDWVLRYTATMRTTARERAEAGVYPPEYAGAPDDLVRVLSSPDILHIVVCGDPHRNRVMVLEGGHTQPVTREVRWPTTT